MRAPIFIVGLNKSGTSLLYLMLAKHPDLSGIAAPVLSKTGTATLYLAHHGLTEGHKLPGLPHTLRPTPNSNLFAAPGFIAEHRASDCDARDEDRAQAAAAYAQAMAEPDKRLVEKSPPNLVRTRYLQSLFPDATFVAIVRDPYINVAANTVKHNKWGSIADQAAHWAGGHGAFLADRPHLKQCATIRYEDLTARPEATLRAVCEACNLDFDPGMLGVVEIRRGLNAELLARLDRGARAEITRMVPASVMAAFGYARQPPLDPVRRAPPRWARDCEPVSGPPTRASAKAARESAKAARANARAARAIAKEQRAAAKKSRKRKKFESVTAE